MGVNSIESITMTNLYTFAITATLTDKADRTVSRSIYRRGQVTSVINPGMVFLLSRKRVLTYPIGKDMRLAPRPACRKGR